MLSGINFSPPLYFLFNFIAQLIYPWSIEFLRFESVIWTLFGVTLTFLVCRNAFGNNAAIISVLLVISQSSLLLQQSLEARHYTMFFACGSWVLYETNRCKLHKQNSKEHILLFSSHLSLCLVHYLGIIFSGFLVLAIFFVKTGIPITKRVPYSVYTSWCLTASIYIFMLYKQSSHLNTWYKHNDLNSLLSVYNDSIFILVLTLPVIFLILSYKVKNTQNSGLPTNHSILIVTSLLWLATPLTFWILSHCSDYNLFKDRYFIPKEAALVVIVAFVINKFQAKFNTTKRSLFPALAIMIFSLFIITIEFKRSLFAMDPDRNFHHWLLVKDKISKSKLPLVFVGDPLFFPNAYKLPEKTYFLLNDKSLCSIYTQFSEKIKVVNFKELNEFNSFILISARNDLPKLNSSAFEITNLGKFHVKLSLVCTKFEKMKSPEPAPPA